MLTASGSGKPRRAAQGSSGDARPVILRCRMMGVQASWGRQAPLADSDGKANHLKPIHSGGTASITTRRTPAENKPSTRTADGHRTGILMAANLELTGRTPAFFVAASNRRSRGSAGASGQ